MNLNEFLAALKYGATVEGDITFSNAGGTLTLAKGLPFTATISSGTGSLANSTTGTPIYAASNVTNGRAIFLTGFSLTGNGGWAIGDVGTIYVQDSSGTNFIGISVNAIKNGTTLTVSSGGSVNVLPAFYLGTGATIGAGLRLNADTSGSFGSVNTNTARIDVTVSGLIR